MWQSQQQCWTSRRRRTQAQYLSYLYLLVYADEGGGATHIAPVAGRLRRPLRQQLALECCIYEGCGMRAQATLSKLRCPRLQQTLSVSERLQQQFGGPRRQ